ncbi:MAG: LytTR family DNA-binding domain-containing protein [Lachnospiraceae bacterium]|nr:LytTR family DNA-binding domain-containing protein [Lachnospiraceae bacterium]
MLNIGICDDDKQFAHNLEKLIWEYLDSNGSVAEIQTFTNSRDLITCLEKENNIDLLFLDIELNDITGVDIGNMIRRDMHNDFMQIVFVSSKENYAMQLFNIRPFDFLLKPIDYKKVEYIMDEYSRLYMVKQNYFEYRIGKICYKIDEQAILYFQSIGRKISMVTSNGTKEFYGKLSELTPNLKAQSFVVIHKSYIINRRYVSEYSRDSVTMTNGDVVPVSRSMRDKLSEMIIENEWGKINDHNRIVI